MERPASNGSCAGCRLGAGPAARAATALAAVLIVTIVGDILGNVLVILSVLRNKKLRNAGGGFYANGICRGYPLSRSTKAKVALVKPPSKGPASSLKVFGLVQSFCEMKSLTLDLVLWPLPYQR